MKRIVLKSCVPSAVLAALLLQGCAGTGGGFNPGAIMSGQQGSTVAGALGALAGAAAGAGIGKATGSDHVKRDAAIGAVLGAVGGYVWNQKMEQQRVAMEKATQGTGIGVEKTQDNRLKIEVPSDAGFATAQAAIQPRLQGVLDKLAETLRANPTTTLNIIGHTDSSGNDSINNPLSQSRADSTRAYLVAKGVDPTRISTVGVGSTQPVADNSTATGRAQNRRVEIYVGQKG